MHNFTISWISLYLETLRYTISYPVNSVPSLSWIFIISTIEIRSSLYIKATTSPPLDEAISAVCQVCIKVYKSVHEFFTMLKKMKTLKKSQKQKQGWNRLEKECKNKKNRIRMLSITRIRIWYARPCIFLLRWHLPCGRGGRGGGEKEVNGVCTYGLKISCIGFTLSDWLKF